MKLYLAIIFSYVAAVCALGLIVCKSVLMWFDATYVASLHLPTYGDSLGIPIFSAILFGGFVFFVLSILYGSLIAASFYKKKMGTMVKKSDASLKLRQGRVAKILIMIFAILCIIILYVPPFYVYVNPFLLVIDVLSCGAGILSALLLCQVATGFSKKSIVKP